MASVSLVAMWGLSVGSVLAGAAPAGPCELVVDLDAEGKDATFGTQHAALGGSVLFVGGRDPDRPAIYRTHGCAGNPIGGGIERLTEPDHGEPLRLYTVGRRVLFFTATGPWSDKGRLWASDGTPEGTRILKAVPLLAEPALVRATVHEDELLFVAMTASDIVQLWRSDGTEAGTAPIATLPPWPEGDLLVSDIIVGGATIYFGVADAEHGLELWSSDGTAEGTHLVNDLNPGPQDSTPSRMVWWGGYLFYAADDGVVGAELRRYEPASGHSKLMIDVPSSDYGSLYDEDADGLRPSLFDDALLWTTNGPARLWRLDDPDGHAAEVEGALNTTSGGSWAYVDDSTLGGELIWFIVRSKGGGCDPGPGALVVSDGTAPGTQPLATFISPAGHWLWTGNELLVAGDDGAGMRLWASDGTVAGTEPVAANLLPPQARDAAPAFLAGGSAVAVLWEPEYGRELWVQSGPSGPWSLLADLARGSEGADPVGLHALDSTLLFSARSSTQDPAPRLWSWDSGGGGGLASLEPEPPFGLTLKGVAVTGDGVAHLRADQADLGVELWRSDLSSGSVEPVVDFCPGYQDTGGWMVCPLALCSGAAVVMATGAAAYAVSWKKSCGYRLHRVDLAEPELLTPACYDDPYGYTPKPSELTEVGDELWFVWRDEEQGDELWHTDGTAEGTSVLLDLAPGPDDSAPEHLRVHGPWMYMSAYIPPWGRELYRVNTSTLEVELVFEATPGSKSGQPGPTLVYGSGLVFAAVHETLGRELWWHDPATGEVDFLVDLKPGPSSLDPTPWAVFGTRLLVRAGNSTPATWWVTDGTPEGSFELAELWGVNHSDVQSPVVVGEEALVVQVDDGIHGREPWRTDGTPHGTWLIQDLRAGPLGSDPEEFVHLSDAIWFSANDGRHGRELWRLPLTLLAP